MRANVLNDAALVKQAGQFAWLSIDSDQPVNAVFVDRFATGGVPLFVVIDPGKEQAVLSWYGTATASQLVNLLVDGKNAIGGGATGANALLARGDEMNGQKKPGEAATWYEQALQSGGPSWAHRTRTIESLVMAYEFSQNGAKCIETAAREAPGMRRDRSFVNTVYFGLDCAKPATPELKQMETLAEEGVKIPGYWPTIRRACTRTSRASTAAMGTRRPPLARRPHGSLTCSSKLPKRLKPKRAWAMLCTWSAPRYS